MLLPHNVFEYAGMIAWAMALVLMVVLLVRPPALIAAEYRRPLLVGLYLQAFLLLYFCVLLDGHVSLDIYLIGWFAFWGGGVLVLLRRPKSPTRADRLYLQWGILPLTVLLQPLARVAWHWLGRM